MMAKVLQAEIDLLLNEDENFILHPVVQRSNSLAAAIQRAASGNDTTDVSGLLDEEIMHSYHELTNSNAVVKERIRSAQRKLQSLQQALDEQQEIYRLLAQLRQEEQIQNETTIGAVEQMRTKDERLRVENTQLREDLKYVTDCVERERRRDKDDDDARPTLLDLLQKLMCRRLECPDDPYIDLASEQTNALDLILLRNTWMIETYNDAELVCLIDYTASTETAT